MDAALLKEQAQTLRDHGALMKDHGALVETAVGQVAEASRALGLAGAALKEHGDKLEARAAQLYARLHPPQPQQAAATGVWRTVWPLVNGGASGMLATCVIQPVDMVKVRIQLGEGTAGQVIKNMLANEGVNYTNLKEFNTQLLIIELIQVTIQLGEGTAGQVTKIMLPNEGGGGPFLLQGFVSRFTKARGIYDRSPGMLQILKETSIAVGLVCRYHDSLTTLFDELCRLPNDLSLVGGPQDVNMLWFLRTPNFPPKFFMKEWLL